MEIEDLPQVTVVPHGKAERKVMAWSMFMGIGVAVGSYFLARNVVNETVKDTQKKYNDAILELQVNSAFKD